MNSAHPLSVTRASHTVITTLLFVIGCAACAAASSPPPERVANGDAPDHGTETLVLEESWRRGGEDDDLFFGLVVAALPGDDGLLYLLDYQLNEVIVLDGDGEYTATLGRRGEGPGEFRNCGALVWMPDATLGVVQQFPGRVVQLKLDGTPAGTFLPSDPAAGGRDVLNGARTVADGLILCGAHMTRDGEKRQRRSFLSLYGTDGAPAAEYHHRIINLDFSARTIREIDSDYVDDGRWDVLPDGRVIVAPERDRYALFVHDPEGTPLLEITRPADPPLRSAERRDRMEARYKASRRYQRMGIEQEFSPSDPMIRTISVRPDGEIWVLPTEGTRPEGDGVFQTWDVFTDAGNWDRRVSLVCDGDPERDRLFLLEGGRALVVSGFQDARDALTGQGNDEESEMIDAKPMEVILYTIR